MFLLESHKEIKLNAISHIMNSSYGNDSINFSLQKIDPLRAMAFTPDFCLFAPKKRTMGDAFKKFNLIGITFAF